MDNQQQRQNESQTAYSHYPSADPQAAYGHYPPADPNKDVMTTGAWLVTFLITCIPIVGFVMMFVWAFGNGNENRRNLYRAYLILALISLALSIVGVIFFAFIGITFMNYY